MMFAELTWSTKTLFTSPFTITNEIIIRSSCPGIIPSKSELKKTISAAGNGLFVLFIFSEDKLRTSLRCFLQENFIMPPPTKPSAITLMVLLSTSSSSCLSRTLSSSKVLWCLGFPLPGAPLESDVLEQSAFASQLLYHISKVVTILRSVLETVMVLAK